MMKKGVAYFGNRYIEHYRNDLATMVKAGCSMVLHTFSENDQKFYKESLRAMIAESKAAGLEVYVDPWGVGKVFGGEAFSAWLLANPTEWQELNSGAKRAIACLNSARFREFIKQWVDDACQIGADVIFIDEPHWYSCEWFLESELWGCCCSRCRNQFLNERGYALPSEECGATAEFKAAVIVEFINLIAVRAADRGVRTAVCLLPSDEPIDRAVYEQVASLPEVAIIGTDPYWVLADKRLAAEDCLAKWLTVISDLASRHNKQSELWLQNFHLPADELPSLAKAIAIMKRGQIDRLMAWSYYGSKGMSSLACEDYEAVWQQFCDI